MRHNTHYFDKEEVRPSSEGRRANLPARQEQSCQVTPSHLRKNMVGETMVEEMNT